jgi:hypothetical protein
MIGGIAALVVVGTFEAAESARQLAELTGFSQLRPAGAGLTALGILASSLIYLALGWWLAHDRRALLDGAIVGVAAGLIGGSIRAALIADAVRDAISRYAEVPEWFIVSVLVVFVAMSALVSAAAGAALAFAGVRLSRSWGRRPRP